MTARVLLLAAAVALSPVASLSASPGGAEKAEPEEAGTGSAAVAGRFTALPPSDHAYPTGILVKMRKKLAGTAGADPDPEADDGSHGH
ncbi:MAG: hypothetical protein ACU0DK_08425 [Pseudooceanicola sp.]